MNTQKNYKNINWKKLIYNIISNYILHELIIISIIIAKIKKIV